MIDYLGSAGALLFTIAAIYQVTKVWREGHGKGLSWGYLLLVWIGFWCMGSYTVIRHSGGPLIYSYSLQLVAFTVMIVRKRFPKA